MFHVVHRLCQIADTFLQLGRRLAKATVDCWGNVCSVRAVVHLVAPDVVGGAVSNLAVVAFSLYFGKL